MIVHISVSEILRCKKVSVCALCVFGSPLRSPCRVPRPRRLDDKWWMITGPDHWRAVMNRSPQPVHQNGDEDSVHTKLEKYLNVQGQMCSMTKSPNYSNVLPKKFEIHKYRRHSRESARSGESFVMIINVRQEICLMLSYVYRVPNTEIRPRPSCPLLCITFFIVIIIIIIIIIIFFILLFFMVIVNKKRKLAGRTSSGGVAFSCLCLPSLGEVGPRYTLCTSTNVGYTTLRCCMFLSLLA